jgi:DNA-3-methyladenine glycosylase
VAGSPDLSVLSGSSVEVAPLLLGATLRHGDVAVRLTEVEAYAGARDPGSHAYRGRTARNAVMFGPAGFLYCYFVYGMHVCANVVTGPEGEAGAVLLRAGEVLGDDKGHDDQGHGDNGRDDRGHPARGPARLCRTLGITLAEDGTDLRAGPVTLELADPVPAASVSTGPRVGLRQAPDVPWRFWLTGEPSVSAYRPAAPRRPRG